MVEYELNNPGETAMVRLPSLQYRGAGKSSPKTVYHKEHLSTK